MTVVWVVLAVWAVLGIAVALFWGRFVRWSEGGSSDEQ